MKLRIVFVCLTVLAAAGCGVEEPRADTAPAVAAAPSVQRPEVAWSSTEMNRVRRIMNNALTLSPYFANAGVAIADASGRILYAKNADRAYAPASTLKPLVAAAAFATLGAAAHFDTRLASLDRPDSGGTIDDLWLVGGGDPVLDPDTLRDGIGSLYRDGVRRVDGDVIVDPAPFTQPEQNPDWAPDDFEYDYAAGTSVISLNWNVIEFKVAPTRIGAPAKVTLVPDDPDIVVHGTPITGYTTTLKIDRAARGRNVFTMSGSIADGAEQSYFRPVDGIPLWAAQVVAQMLRQRHIELAGDVRLGHDPTAAQTLWEHRSPPLRAMIHQMLFESDNHIAEQLLRILSVAGGNGVTEATGSEEAGARVERAYLRSHDIPMPGLRIVDGSGLAETDRIAPVTQVLLLESAAEADFGHDYVSAFPRAGIEGTVRHHDLNAAFGRVRAKSGHIDGVNALVGYVDTRHHGRLAFSFLVNAPDADDATSIQVGIDRALDDLSLL